MLKAIIFILTVLSSVTIAVITVGAEFEIDGLLIKGKNDSKNPIYEYTHYKFHTDASNDNIYYVPEFSTINGLTIEDLRNSITSIKKDLATIVSSPTKNKNNYEGINQDMNIDEVLYGLDKIDSFIRVARYKKKSEDKKYKRISNNKYSKNEEKAFGEGEDEEVTNLNVNDENDNNDGLSDKDAMSMLLDIVDQHFANNNQAQQERNKIIKEPDNMIYGDMLETKRTRDDLSSILDKFSSEELLDQIIQLWDFLNKQIEPQKEYNLIIKKEDVGDTNSPHVAEDIQVDTTLLDDDDQRWTFIDKIPKSNEKVLIKYSINPSENLSLNKLRLVPQLSIQLPVDQIQKMFDFYSDYTNKMDGCKAGAEIQTYCAAFGYLSKMMNIYQFKDEVESQDESIKGYFNTISENLKFSVEKTYEDILENGGIEECNAESNIDHAKGLSYLVMTYVFDAFRGQQINPRLEEEQAEEYQSHIKNNLESSENTQIQALMESGLDEETAKAEWEEYKNKKTDELEILSIAELAQKYRYMFAYSDHEQIAQNSYGPKMSLNLMSRSGFYVLYNDIDDPCNKKAFVNFINDKLCANGICEEMTVSAFELGPSVIANMINTGITLREWLDSIINNDGGIRVCALKAALPAGNALAEANFDNYFECVPTDLLSPPEIMVEGYVGEKIQRHMFEGYKLSKITQKDYESFLDNKYSMGAYIRPAHKHALLEIRSLGHLGVVNHSNIFEFVQDGLGKLVEYLNDQGFSSKAGVKNTNVLEGDAEESMRNKIVSDSENEIKDNDNRLVI